jgi:hypothetical protein
LSEREIRTGYRAFIVDGDNVLPLSHKKFEALHFRDEPALPDFAGRTIRTVFVLYTLKGRKPERVFRIDSHRVRIGPDGRIDERDRRRTIELMAHRLSDDDGSVSRDGNVLDAKARFDQKEWEDRHASLPGPVHKKILTKIFGG